MNFPKTMMMSVWTVTCTLVAIALCGSAKAQTPTPNFFLTSSSTSAGPNATVTIYLNLVDGADDTTGLGNGLSSFDTNISFSNNSLMFISAFTGDPASPFSDQLTNVMTASALRASFQVPFSSSTFYDATGKSIILGSFQVQASASGLPAGGTVINLGSQTVSVNSGGSELINGKTITNVLQSVTPVTLASAPEPAGLLPLLFGATGLTLLAWRRRRAA